MELGKGGSLGKKWREKTERKEEQGLKG